MKKYEDFFTEKTCRILSLYVPENGHYDNMASQTIACCIQLIKRYYENGDVYDNKKSLFRFGENISSYANWLYDNVQETKEVLDKINTLGKNDFCGYTEILYSLLCICFNEKLLDILKMKPARGNIYNHAGQFTVLSCEEKIDEEYEYFE